MDKTKLSRLFHIGSVNATADKTRQFCLVLSAVFSQFPRVLSRLDPVSNLQLLCLKYIQRLLKTWKLETGSRQDKTVSILSAVVFTPPTRTRQSCLVRVVSVNELLQPQSLHGTAIPYSKEHNYHNMRKEHNMENGWKPNFVIKHSVTV